MAIGMGRYSSELIDINGDDNIKVRFEDWVSPIIAMEKTQCRVQKAGHGGFLFQDADKE